MIVGEGIWNYMNRLSDYCQLNHDQGLGFEELDGERFYFQTEQGTLPQSYFHKRFQKGLSNNPMAWATMKKEERESKNKKRSPIHAPILSVAISVIGFIILMIIFGITQYFRYHK